MQKAFFCCLLLVGMFANSIANAVPVQFAGTLTNYVQLVGAADPLGLLGNPVFTGQINTATNGLANSTVINGTVMIGATNFTLGAGTFASNAANTQFNGMALGAPGLFTTASLVSLPGNLLDSLPGLAPLIGQSANFSLVVNGGGNIGIYQGIASVTAVPEPTSMALVASSLFGLAGYGWRRRRKAAAKV